ncbi:MAG: hypothetical protein ACJAXS_002984, partial [Colwellia sp.]
LTSSKLISETISIEGMMILYLTIIRHILSIYEINTNAQDNKLLL